MMELLGNIDFNSVIYGNSIDQYIFALQILLATMIIIKIFKVYILSRLKKLAAKTDTIVDDVIIASIERIGVKFYFSVALYIALRLLVLPVFIYDVTYAMMVMIVVYYIIRVASIWIEFLTKKIQEDEDRDPHSIEIISKVAKAVIWVIGFVFILQFLGYDVTTLVAGLGIGGIAIAFALQNVLSDIFASFTIYYDKPFKKGDYVVIGQDSGTVLATGLKSTRIQTLQGDELVISNKTLTEERIHNYKKMVERRINFKFGIEYGTPTKKMKRIEKLVKKIFDDIPEARLQSIKFFSFGDFSLIYDVIYFVKTRDYDTYLKVQEEVNFGIKEAFEKEGISMAFPTQTLYIKK